MSSESQEEGQGSWHNWQCGKAEIYVTHMRITQSYPWGGQELDTAESGACTHARRLHSQCNLKDAAGGGRSADNQMAFVRRSRWGRPEEGQGWRSAEQFGSCSRGLGVSWRVGWVAHTLE